MGFRKGIISFISINIWKVAIKKVMETQNVPFHYALTLSTDSKYCFSCFSDGSVGWWDLSSGTLIKYEIF